MRYTCRRTETWHPVRPRQLPSSPPGPNLFLHLNVSKYALTQFMKASRLVGLRELSRRKNANNTFLEPNPTHS